MIVPIVSSISDLREGNVLVIIFIILVDDVNSGILESGVRNLYSNKTFLWQWKSREIFIQQLNKHQWVDSPSFKNRSKEIIKKNTGAPI